MEIQQKEATILTTTIVVVFLTDTMQATPRVRHTRNSATDPVSRQQKWRSRAENNYQSVVDTYLRILDKCLLWHHIIRHSTNKKQRQHAKKCFLRKYPTLMSIYQIGIDLPVYQILDRLYYHLNTH